MKKAYVKPTVESEAFVANRCVAACENPSSYVGYCDISGRVYADSNNSGQYEDGIDQFIYTNTACNQMYESQVQPHFNAFVVDREWIPRHWEGGFPIVGGGHWVEGHWQINSATPVFNYDDHVTQHIDPVRHYNVSI